MSGKVQCLRYEQIFSYNEGNLPADEMRIAAMHLESCPACQAALASMLENVDDDSSRDDGGSPLNRTPRNQPDAPTMTYQASPESMLDLSDGRVATEPLQQLSGYDLVGVLGQGGYGVVYEAIDRILNRKVAIKVLKRDFANRAISRRRFIREARAGAAVNHPNVVTIHGVDEAGDMPFLIMELVRGESLRERIRRQPKLEILDILRISAQVAQGLAAAHAQGIIHRDVKPGNIMLVDSLPRVKITDFGLARVKLENLELTSRGVAVGTPTYMSPEQIRGQEIDSRSDLFALGCVMYAMLTGHSPFHARTTLDILRRIDSYDPPPLNETHTTVPEFLADIVQRLLKKDPEKRYQSAAEVADILNRHLAVLNQTPSDRLPAVLAMRPLERRWPVVKQRKAAVWAGGLLLAAAATAAWIHFGRDTASSPVVNYAASSAPITASSAAAAATVDPVPKRRAKVTVARSNDADFSSIAEALQHVAPGGEVIIQDSGEYVEAIRLEDTKQYAGVTLSAPEHATLRSPAAGPVIAIRGIPQLRVIGLKIVSPQSQFAIEITGACPGLLLEDVTVERTANSGATGRFAAVCLRNGACGTADEPITIRRLALRSTVVGVVIGNPDATGDAPAHLVLEESFIRGTSRKEATLLVLRHGTQDVVVRRNIFAEGLQGLSIVADQGALPQRCLVSHNTWHEIETWIVWNSQVPQNIDIEVCHNLMVDCRRTSPGGRALATVADAVFDNNLLFNPHQSSAEGFSPSAESVADFPLLSYDADHADYLKPDWEGLQYVRSSTAEIPGRYSLKDRP